MWLEVMVKGEFIIEALLVEASSRNAHNPNNASKNVSLFFGIRASGTLMTAYLSGYSLKYLRKD